MSDTATPDALRGAALRYLADRAVEYLLQVGEPAKTGQITGFVSEDQPVSAKVVRDALTLDPRFMQRDRRWDLAARDVNPQHPLERTISDFLAAVGRPLTVETLGVEVGRASGVSVEASAETVRRLVTNRPRFAYLGDERVSPVDWLLDVESGNPEDVLFENFDEDDEVDRYRDAAKGADWSAPAKAAVQTISAAGNAVPGKVMAYLAYEAAPEGFDPAEFHKALVDSDLIRMSDGAWITPDLVNGFGAIYEQIADEPPVEGAPTEASRAGGEVAITPADMDEISVIVRRADGLITSRQLLEQVLEVGANEPDYERWEAALAEALQQQGDLISVGWDRWRRLETMPTHVLDVPESLTLQEFSFQTMEGEETDVILSEDGLDGNLREAVTSPLATMGGECVRQEDGSARCTVTILHHETGTLPVGGEDPFFPADPVLIEATLIGPDGRFPLWVNNGLNLAFGLEGLYSGKPETGFVFFLHPANRLGEYRVEPSDELDPRVGLEESRIKELRAIARRPTFADTSTFDLIGELLEKHRKGADFFTLLAELWVMRPVSALQVASILSGYHCFKQNKNGTWSFDAREVDKGFKKTKRKYIL